MQEVANAVSMIFPVIFLWYAWYTDPIMDIAIFAVGTTLQFPFSFYYHIKCAMKRYDDVINNNERRMDQSIQHIVCVMFAYAISGSRVYAIFNSVINCICLYRLWFVKHHSHWIEIMYCVALYILPMIIHNDITNFTYCVLSICIGGGFCFISHLNFEYLNGWGHTLFHLLLVLHANALVRFAQSVYIRHTS